MNYLYVFNIYSCFFIYRSVRVDTVLNKKIWSQGVRNVPRRIRVRLERRRDEDEDAKEKVLFFVSFAD
jgi:large subunit ribosomal protein L31e